MHVVSFVLLSSGEGGVVYVRTRGTNQKGQDVLSYVRWVMVPKRDHAAFGRFLRELGYDYSDESRNPAYRLFLK